MSKKIEMTVKATFNGSAAEPQNAGFRRRGVYTLTVTQYGRKSNIKVTSDDKHVDYETWNGFFANWMNISKTK